MSGLIKKKSDRYLYKGKSYSEVVVMPQVLHVEQELLTLPEHMSSSGFLGGLLCTGSVL
jgi:hypothetical protein